MTDLSCAVVACQSPAVTIYRGYTLCERCYRITDGIPEHVPAKLIEGIISGVIEREYTIDNSMLRWGYTQPRDRPFEGIEKERSPDNHDEP